MCSSLVYIVYYNARCKENTKFTRIITFTKRSVINQFSQRVQILLSQCVLLVQIYPA